MGLEVRVGIADLNTVRSPGKIMTIGLGSCIGIVLYDKIRGIGGLAHIMLPDSTQFKDVKNPLKFADLAIPILLKELEKLGCSKRNLSAKIAGGASMFNFLDKSMISDIGKRNSEAVIVALKALNIPIVAQEVGGNKGRTMILDAKNGSVIIKVVGQGLIEL